MEALITPGDRVAWADRFPADSDEQARQLRDLGFSEEEIHEAQTAYARAQEASTWRSMPR